MGRASNLSLCVLSFAAGVASLICETVWIQRFSFVFGSTAPAASAVVAVFLGGLAIGSWYFGKASAGGVEPLRLFAVLQAAVGLYAIAFPAFLRAGESFYAGLYPRTAESAVLTAAARIAIASCLLILPTALMGGTLPLLVQAGVGRSESIGRLAGILNALNTAGAAAGGFLCGYLLLRRLGVRSAGSIAGVLDLAVGLVAWLFARAASRADGEASEAPAQSDEATPRRSVAFWAVLCFALSGFAGIAYEMLFLRTLVFYFRDTIYLYSGVISGFILWLGVGSALSGALLGRMRWPAAALGLAQAALGVASLLAFTVPVRWHQALFLAGRSSPALSLSFVLALLAVPGILLGATFPLVAEVVARDARFAGKRIGAVYALNTAGAIAGSLVTVFVLVPALGIEDAVLGCVLLNLLASGAVLAADREFPRRKAALSACALTAILAFALVRAVGIALPLTLIRDLVSPGDEIVEIREGVTGTASVVKSAKGGYELWSDAVAISATRNGSFYAPGIVPVVLSPRIPERVLSLAFGGGLSTYGLRLFPEVRRIDCVDLSRENMELALERFPENAGFRDDARARFVVDDARSFLRYSGARYDLILVEATPPRLSFRNAFLFTKEFYESAARSLNGGGLFVQALPLADLSLAETLGVLKTFAAVFPGRAMWFIGGPDVLMMGGEAPLTFSYGETARRLARPRISRELEERLSIAQYQAAGNLFSGILLDSKAWERVAEGAEILTEDRLPLLFSTGRDGGSDNVRLIHERLAPWSDVLARLTDREEVERLYEPGGLERRLEDRRQFFAAHLYGARLFYPAMLDYIGRFALDKAGERARLYEVLRARGRDAEAEDLAERMRRSAPRAP